MQKANERDTNCNFNLTAIVALKIIMNKCNNINNVKENKGTNNNANNDVTVSFLMTKN